MDLTKYYPDIAAKYPAYVTKRELCEICRICPKTAYNLEQQGEIPYTIEQNHLIRSHKIKLTDILAYLYRRECRQEADSPYICAMRTFYDKHLSPYVCINEIGDIIKPNYVSCGFPKLLEEHGLRRVRYHDLRHSCASLLLANGVPMKQIQEWLGHSDFSTTANIYAHLEYSSKVISADAMLAGLGIGNRE